MHRVTSLVSPPPPTKSVADAVGQSIVAFFTQRAWNWPRNPSLPHAPRCQSAFTCDFSSTRQGEEDGLRNLLLLIVSDSMKEYLQEQRKNILGSYAGARYFRKALDAS